MRSSRRLAPASDFSATRCRRGFISLRLVRRGDASRRGAAAAAVGALRCGAPPGTARVTALGARRVCARRDGRGTAAALAESDVVLKNRSCNREATKAKSTAAGKCAAASRKAAKILSRVRWRRVVPRVSDGSSSTPHSAFRRVGPLGGFPMDGQSEADFHSSASTISTASSPSSPPVHPSV